jgi:hypothetical protein
MQRPRAWLTRTAVQVHDKPPPLKVLAESPVSSHWPLIEQDDRIYLIPEARHLLHRL